MTKSPSHGSMSLSSGGRSVGACYQCCLEPRFFYKAEVVCFAPVTSVANPDAHQLDDANQNDDQQHSADQHDLAGDVSPTTMTRLDHEDQDQEQNQETIRAPLPKLVLPSFDPLSDVGIKYDKEIPKQDIQTIVRGETRSPGLKIAKYSVKCDVYYSSIPWEPARTDQFENATAALSNYCLNILMSEDRIYSNIILWTSYTPRADPSKRQQRFTVLPSYLKPDRNALGRDDKYDWAIIAFRDGPYDAMLGYGLTGFSADETGIVDKALERLRVKQFKSEDSESTCIEQGSQNELKAKSDESPGSDCDSEIHGFLEHQEESIAQDALDNQFEFSGLSEDLDMASRLGGETLQ
ncbi:hypothetical protein VMCG_00369 [Cytospora schulzeri]|uniref:Uncharacterized protein n=1 Tax=Cytospora schulzeri TaxID=448051 RepID=A0A423X8B8_9PEZI|nr:hypothetical protein VMCG_00369 [Valsa malicola]